MRIALAIALLLITIPVNAGEIFASGIASWYGSAHAGRRTANGEIFDPMKLTAAHRTLSFGTQVRVSHGNQHVTVRINDRGPFTGGRIIDLSQAAARAIGLERKGTGQVTLELL